MSQRQMGAPRGGQLLRAQNAREAQRRVDEYKRDELVKFKNLDTMLQGNARCEGRAEAARRDRESKARAQEDGTMEGLYRQHKQAMYESKTAEEDARIAAFLQKQQQDLERDERLVQRVRQDSDELRQLQEKLNMAEVSMMRKLQLQEKKVVQAQQAAYDSALDAQVEKTRLQQCAAEEAKEQRRREEQVLGAAILTEQMEERHAAQRAQKKEFERERSAVDEIVRKIHEEDHEELVRKKHKQEATKKYIREFMLDREKMRTAQRAAQQAEEDEIRAYNDAVAARQAGLAAKEKAKADEAARVLAEIVKKKEAEERARAQLEDLINKLHFEEEQKKLRDAKKAKEEAQAKARLEMLRANDYQLQLKAQRRQKEAEIEEENTRRMLQKFAEDEKAEKEGELRRQKQMAEFKAEVEGLAAYKRGLYDAQKAAELEEYARFQAEEDKRQAIIESERKRLLLEHAVRLMEFLPKGTLQRPEDLEMLVSVLMEGGGGQTS